MTDNVDAIRILCIEDDMEMIDLVKLILTRKGYEVIGAVGGQAGLETIEQVKPDLVLLDLMMPDMDGWEVFQQMRANEHTKNIPVIVVTAKAQSIDKVLGLHIAKVDDYITKPFGPSELLSSVLRVLAEAGIQAEEAG
ncbi:MAG TPA: response regulator [Aggregatilineaceae bacterium]|jgi:DNA-binding response OmpR family regulator|nr:response regulator [Aggregatilineaceae bacterium]